MWGDDELQQVAAVLPAFKLCESLTITRQGFGDRGLGTLCGALPSLGRLLVLVMGDCISFTGSGFEALAGQHMSVLEVLDLSRTGIDDQGVGALAQQLPRFLQLKSLYLQGCRGISTLGMMRLVDCLPHLPILEALLVGDSAIGDECLNSLAKRVPFLTRLRTLDLRGCESITAVGLDPVTECLTRLHVKVWYKERTCNLRHDMTSFPTDVNGYLCDVCSRDIPIGEIRYHCGLCGYDVCVTCAQGALCLPSHLASTVEGQRLAEVWAATGQHVSELRWL